MTTGAEGASSKKGIVEATTLDAIDVPDFPKASESTRTMMAAFLGIEKPTEEQLKMIDGMIYQMQMSAYNYLKRVFEKSRKRRQEIFRQEQRSRRM